MADTDERLWQAVYEAGVDTVLSHDLGLSASQDHLNLHHLKNKVQRVLARVPSDKWKAWEVSTRRRG